LIFCFFTSREFMMKKVTVIAAAGVLLASLSMPVMASQALAMSKGCLGCHAADKKLVGPSYQEISAKYAGQKGVEGALAEKMIKGSSGTWGPVAMPPNPSLSPADAATLAKWVLSGAK
jgi:cytochrome c